VEDVLGRRLPPPRPGLSGKGKGVMTGSVGKADANVVDVHSSLWW